MVLGFCGQKRCCRIFSVPFWPSVLRVGDLGEFGDWRKHITKAMVRLLFLHQMKDSRFLEVSALFCGFLRWEDGQLMWERLRNFTVASEKIKEFWGVQSSSRIPPQPGAHLFVNPLEESCIAGNISYLRSFTVKSLAPLAKPGGFRGPGFSFLLCVCDLVHVACPSSRFWFSISHMSWLPRVISKPWDSDVPGTRWCSLPYE